MAAASDLRNEQSTSAQEVLRVMEEESVTNLHLVLDAALDLRKNKEQSASGACWSATTAQEVLRGIEELPVTNVQLVLDAPWIAQESTA